MVFFLWYGFAIERNKKRMVFQTRKQKKKMKGKGECRWGKPRKVFSLWKALVASVFSMSPAAHAHPPDCGVPRADGPAVPTAAMQVQLDALSARVRRLEAERDARASPGATPTPAGPGAAATPTPAATPFVLGGYAEVFYEWNFNKPSNGITNFRGFDNRHNTFTLSNVALDASWDLVGLIGRVTLQVGHTPSTYYLGEASLPGASGANATGPELWKYVQQAYVGYRFGLGRGLTVTAGLFLSPIGPESMAVKDNWNWSRSNLFFGLPFYHTGVRATYALSDEWAVTLAGYNGWNSVGDHNDGKSVSAQVTFTRANVIASILYFGGVERPHGTPEGQPWRHLADAHLMWHATPWLSLLAHANGGFEQNEFGQSAWGAGALYARFRIIEPLFFAVRGDIFYEHVAENASGRAAPIFWPAPWVSSGTATVDYRPHERLSFRIEYRHDHAGADLYFGGNVAGDGSATPFVTNRASQDTVMIGATTWF